MDFFFCLNETTEGKDKKNNADYTNLFICQKKEVGEL